MPNFKSVLCQTNGYRPAPTPTVVGDVKAVRGSYARPATIAQNEIVELVPLPPGCIPVDCILDSDDLDAHATPTITVSVGVINSEGTDLVANTTMISASQVARAGGIARMDQKTGPRIPVNATAKRNVGVKIDGAIATAQAGTIGLTLLYRAVDFGQ
jgi:hypothetical protein